ncbi:MAG: YidC/Oxa1 family membrane protein insertase [bacterium]|nr:YidC/Oxa1 family membrane protein insertase [bacterium]
MEHGILSTLFYIPVYNALVFIIEKIPGHSAGLAVILLTILIRLILFPLSKSSIKTQLQMKRIEPEVESIKKNTKDKQAQAQQLMKLYKDKGINPFAGFFLLLIQLPILIGLYNVFQSGLPTIDTTILYSFVHAPVDVAMSFLGIDLMRKSFILAILAVVTQFIQINLALPKSKKPTESSFQNDLAHSMNVQMRYILPLVMFPIALLSSVIAIYLIASNIFMIFQELFVKRRLEAEYNAQA